MPSARGADFLPSRRRLRAVVAVVAVVLGPPPTARGHRPGQSKPPNGTMGVHCLGDALCLEHHTGAGVSAGRNRSSAAVHCALRGRRGGTGCHTPHRERPPAARRGTHTTGVAHSAGRRCRRRTAGTTAGTPWRRGAGRTPPAPPRGPRRRPRTRRPMPQTSSQSRTPASSTRSPARRSVLVDEVLGEQTVAVRDLHDVLGQTGSRR